MFRVLFHTVMVAVLIWAVGGCSDEEQQKIVLQGNAAEVITKAHQDEGAIIRIAVGGMITPRSGIAYYHDLIQYIGEKIGTTIKYVDREDYAEINELLKAGKLEAAFVCSGPYVEGKRDFGLELLAAPQAYGGTVYYSYIIVAKNSRYRTFEELQGKTFAFTDPLSNTGKLVPTYMLARMNQTPEKFFSKVIFTKSHDNSIKAVAQGIVDGAAVDSLIWEYMNITEPELTAKTLILKKSPPYAIPPVAVPRELAPELKEKLRRTFLNAHLDPDGLNILQKMKIDKFVLIEDGAYDSVREMEAWVSKQQPGK